MATKKANTKTAEVNATDKTAPKKTVTEPEKKVLPVLKDNVRLSVRSNQYGHMCFVNSRNGEKTSWSSINDTQDMTVADIRDMKSNAPRFLEETWIVIESVIEPQYEDMTVDEIYAALGLEKYAVTGRPRYLSDVVNWSRFEIPDRVAIMSRNTKENVAVAINTEVRKGNIRDILTIRAWEEALGMTLDTDIDLAGVNE